MSYHNKRNRRGGHRRHNNSGRSRGQSKSSINPQRFIRKAQPQQETRVEATHQFSDFDLHPDLQASIRRKGFTKPSPIQDQAIPVGLSGKDVFGIANTGTGKTAAFLLPALHKLLNNKGSKVIVIAPTRELAAQILEESKSLSMSRSIYWSLLIGGTSMGKQLRDLSRNPNLIIGTPGRIKDHIDRKSLRLEQFDTVVLDEVDRMLDMGFIDDMRAILGRMPTNRQSFFFSATTTPRVKSLVHEFGNNPTNITIAGRDTSQNVEQDVVRFSAKEDKLHKLRAIIEHKETLKVLIFDETRRDVERLHQSLIQSGIAAESIHGGRTQGQRRRAMRNFKDNSATVMVATDVASRGIDVDDITHVVNYSTPQTYDDYIHRVGRAGRAGKSGFALTFVRH